MLFEVRTEIEVNASAAKVWYRLMYFKNYKIWNNFIQKIEGEPRVGKKIYLKIDE